MAVACSFLPISQQSAMEHGPHFPHCRASKLLSLHVLQCRCTLGTMQQNEYAITFPFGKLDALKPWMNATGISRFGVGVVKQCIMVLSLASPLSVGTSEFIPLPKHFCKAMQNYIDKWQMFICFPYSLKFLTVRIVKFKNINYAIQSPLSFILLPFKCFLVEDYRHPTSVSPNAN